VCLPLPQCEFNRFKVGLRHILVPIDFSVGSKRALVYALPLARIFGARVTLVHVVEPLSCAVDCGYGEVVREWPDDAQTRQARARLTKFARTFDRCGLPLALVLRSGQAFPQIVKAADELNVNLIIIATRALSRHGLEMIGSTAERVARHARCPVLVIRECEREFVTVKRPRGAAGRQREDSKRS
jgi:nucleotide-binding universal stress UspA family protein